MAELEALGNRVGAIEAAILAWHKDNEASRRLAIISGVGPITASAIVASITDPTQFRSARHLAAWIGLVQKQSSSGGKERQGGISKQGDRTLRRQAEHMTAPDRGATTSHRPCVGGVIHTGHSGIPIFRSWRQARAKWRPQPGAVAR
ncbi:transposase [Siccirubricoccus sp. G192]|nr:transposase [Siccirubricoccus sp. G192]